MKTSYMDWINHEIDKHQREIAKLTLAADVIERASKELGREYASAKPQPVKPVKPRVTRVSRYEARNQVLQILADGPKVSGDLSVAIVGKDGDRKPVQNALYHLRINGQIVRDTEGRYSLPPKPIVEEEEAA